MCYALLSASSSLYPIFKMQTSQVLLSWCWPQRRNLNSLPWCYMNESSYSMCLSCPPHDLRWHSLGSTLFIARQPSRIHLVLHKLSFNLFQNLWHIGILLILFNFINQTGALITLHIMSDSDRDFFFGNKFIDHFILGCECSGCNKGSKPVGSVQHARNDETNHRFRSHRLGVGRLLSASRMSGVKNHLIVLP